MQKTSYGLILVLWVAGLGAAGQFAKISLNFEELRAIYPEAGTAAGFLVTLLSLVGVALGLFSGMILSGFGFRRPLVAALVFGAVVSLYQASLPPFGLMLASRFVEGLSHLVIVVAAPTLIARLSSDRDRPAAMTLWGTFFGVAFAVFAWLGMPLAKAYGLGSLFIAHATLMLSVALLLHFMLPADQTAAHAKMRICVFEILGRHVETYRSPTASAVALGWLFYTLSFVSLLTVLPRYIDEEWRSVTAGLMPLAGIASSLTLGVALLNRMSAVHVVLLGFAASGLVTLMFWFSPGSPVLAIALFASLGLVQGASFAAVPQLNANPEAQALANGAMAQMGNLGNLCGTVVLLAMAGALGFSGLILFAVLTFAFGFATHLVLDRQRRGRP